MERQFIRFQQPSEVAKARRIQKLIASGHLKVLPRDTGGHRAGSNEFGEDLANMLEHAQTNGGLVVRPSPVSRIGSYLEEVVDMSAYSGLLTDTRCVAAFLNRRGQVDDATLLAAEMYLHQVDDGWNNSPPINSISTLYLDSLVVTYLDHVDLLDALVRSVGTVFIDEDVQDRAGQVLHENEKADGLLEAIERIRLSVSGGLDTGRVQFSSRQPSEDRTAGDDDQEATDLSPTLDLVSDLGKIEAVVADDRFLNKSAFWADSSGQNAASACTLDVLAALQQHREIDERTHWLARHRLRASGFYAVPVTVSEILHHLSRAPFSEDGVHETPELRAIRESLAQPLIHDAFLPLETNWLVGVRFAVLKSISQTWTDAKDLAETIAKSNWLLSIMPDPLEWCLNPDSEAAWAAARQQVGIQASLLLVSLKQNELTSGYSDWAEQNIATPLREKHPEIWDIALEFLKTYLLRLAETGDDEN